jgi:hypothetical protein
MIQEALSYLVEIGKQQLYREQIGGLEYANQDLKLIKPPRAAALGFARLQGFADFVNLKNEAIDAEHVIIHVASPARVDFVSTLTEFYRDREAYAAAVYAIAGFPFREFMTPDNFVIAVQSLIVDDDKGERGRLLEIVGNAAAEQITTSTDDGVSQTIAAKSGVTLLKKKEVQNPFTLSPYRTFAEVTQPASSFILRARQSGEHQMPMFALFECDNGAWQIDAIASIAEWLKAKVAVPVLA